MMQLVRTFLWLTFLGIWPVSVLSLAPTRVAVIGTTGKLGRETVVQLSKAGIAARCLLRHDISSTPVPSSLEEAKSSMEVAAFLNTLPGVEMVQGDVLDVDSLRNLVQGCDACVSLHGATAPKPFVKALIPMLYPETTPTHPKQINYQGIKNLITVLEGTKIPLVRITGKGESPWSFFSILINTLGGIAKGWNYEAEQLLRLSSVDYRIIRPGVMTDSVDQEKLGVLDNGRDLPVSAVSYAQMAGLVLDIVQKDNCRRSTVTAMNIKDDNIDYQSLDQVQSDSREFPASLIDEHKKTARVGGLVIMAFTLLLAKTVASLIGKLFGVF